MISLRDGGLVAAFFDARASPGQALAIPWHPGPAALAWPWHPGPRPRTKKMLPPTPLPPADWDPGGGREPRQPRGVRIHICSQPCGEIGSWQTLSHL